MKDPARLVAALFRIRDCIDEKVSRRELAYLDELIRSGESTDWLANLSLFAAVKGDKYLWGGMGTLPDNVRLKARMNQAFEDSYLELALVCRDLDLESIYSKDVLDLDRSMRAKRTQ